MFNAFQNPAPPSDAELATQTLNEESSYRFASFSANDAVTLGLSIRKRFRASSRHARGKGLVISIQTIAGHTLFSCTVGDLGHPSGIADVSLDSWACLEVGSCACCLSVLGLTVCVVGDNCCRPADGTLELLCRERHGSYG